MEIIQGDIIELFKSNKYDIIVHGCNCKHVMGVGLAYYLKKEYPEILMQDKIYDRYPGDILAVKTMNGDIINCYTQMYPGRSKGYRNDTSMDRYKYVKECLTKIDNKYKNKKIGVPYIGTGYGGLSRSIVKDLIKGSFKNNKIFLIDYINKGVK